MAGAQEHPNQPSVNLLDRPSVQELSKVKVTKTVSTAIHRSDWMQSYRDSIATSMSSLMLYGVGALSAVNNGPIAATALTAIAGTIAAFGIGKTIRNIFKNHMELTKAPLSHPVAADKINNFVDALLCPTIIAHNNLKYLPKSGPLSTQDLGSLLILKSTDPAVPEQHRAQLLEARLTYLNHEARQAGLAPVAAEVTLKDTEKSLDKLVQQLPQEHPYRLATDMGKEVAEHQKRLLHTKIAKEKKVDQNKFSKYGIGYGSAALLILSQNPILMGAAANFAAHCHYVHRRDKMADLISDTKLPKTVLNFTADYMNALSQKTVKVTLSQKHRP